jgi:hypothetical protein
LQINKLVDFGFKLAVDPMSIVIIGYYYAAVAELVTYVAYVMASHQSDCYV